MTIEETERFYKQDTKNYEIERNKEFLIWLKNLITNGYDCFIDIKELQELINNIVTWYEIKYPERELEYFEGTKDIRFQDIKRISNIMNIKQLLYRLQHNGLCLINCRYRAKHFGQRPIYNNDKVIDWETLIFMKINKINKEKDSYFLLHANNITGKVLKNYDLEEYIDNDEFISLEKLLSILNEKYTNELDFTELEKCIYNHNCDIELRNKILQLVALKLLYSRNTTPERGYERAKRFINEFNKKLNLTLSTKEIDEIICKDYTNDKNFSSSLNIEKINFEQEKNTAGIKKLVKIFFNKQIN